MVHNMVRKKIIYVRQSQTVDGSSRNGNAVSMDAIFDLPDDTIENVSDLVNGPEGGHLWCFAIQ